MEDRFWSKVNKTPTCWLWSAGVVPNGYGKYSVGRREEGCIAAHRYSYIMANGEIPDGLVLRHTCDVRRCVNPEHLVLGTLKQNSTDMCERGRQANGERQGSSKLTADDVREIRIMAGFGFNLKELGKMYNTHLSNIGYILQGKTWGHLK